jgi:hypothetical protein
MNRYESHVYVIPEDDHDRQIAVGFIDHHKVRDSRIQVMPVAGGWRNVLETFRVEYIPKLRDYPKGHVVMLIDFDGDFKRRRAEFEQATPVDLQARVFVVGPERTPEALKNELKKSFEQIGAALADDCDAGTTTFWDYAQLRHNDSDRERLVQTVKPILF